MRKKIRDSRLVEKPHMRDVTANPAVLTINMRRRLK
jgi:hypothetical protein